MLNLRQREQLRRSYRPGRVRLLFIGESPPASGRFFYSGDSGLYRAMRDAFRRVDPSIDDTSFLAAFQASGCYLVDLCPEPVDHLDAKSRRAACQAAEILLARKIVQLRPPSMVTIVRSIEENAGRAASHAKWNGAMTHLPYPGRWSHLRQTFIESLAPMLARLS